MGGGGASDYSKESTGNILKKINASESEALKQEYQTWVNSYIDSTLVDINDRDNDAIKTHINTIKKALGNEIEGVISTQFGGSLSKKTHIDGLSDIDTLVIINKTDLAEKGPIEVLDYFFDILRERYKNTEIKKGDTCVTVSFSDYDIQLLPALKYKGGLKIPDGQEWSKIVQPSVFSRQLTILNQRLSGRMIPAIKLIKTIVSDFPENSRLKGYHIESMAVEIFGSKIKNDSSGSLPDTRALVSAFFKEAPEKLRNKIKDVTGQTTHVDDYLGSKNSINRMIAANSLERVSRRIELADSGSIKETWFDLLSYEK
jgi:hypothetical protein